MTLSAVVAPAAFAFRRMRARPLAVAMVAIAFAGAGALIGWSSLAAALAQEENVRLRLGELPPDERAIQVAYGLVPFESRTTSAARKETAVSVLVSNFGDVTEPRHRVQIWSPIEEGVRLVVAESLADDVAVSSGRLPAGCEQHICEVLALGGDFQPGDRLPLGDRTTVLVVGSGSLRPEVLPSGATALAGIPDPGERGLLVPSIESPLAPLIRASQSTVVATAPLDPGSIHGAELRPLTGRLRRAIVRIERGEALVAAGAPLELLDELADRGEVARARLLLVSGQGAALIIAFAAFAASARRAETRLLDDQLTTLGASRTQVLVSRLVEALVPSLAGAFLALGSLRITADLLAEGRGSPSAFVAAALPLETMATIAAVAALGALLLIAALSPRRRTRFGVGALEVAALAAIVVVVWQAATTEALDPAHIAEGHGVAPVLLLLPALAFFATGVLLLRVLPAMLRLAERLARTAPLSVRLAFLTAARTPTQAAATTTFLAVALGAALFCVNYEATLERQARDEARFTAGARWRVVERSAEEGASSPDVTPLTRFARATAERPTPVFRLDGNLRERLVSGTPLAVEILGLPSARIQSLLGWRKSFSSLSRAKIAKKIRPQPVRLRGTKVAADARALRVWARAQKGRPPRLAVLHFLFPEEQRFAALRLGVIRPGWRRVRVAVPPRLRGAELVGLEFIPTFLPPNAVDPGGFVELARLAELRGGKWYPLPPLDTWTAGTPSGGVAEGSVIAAPFPKDAPADAGIHVELTSTVLPLIRPPIPLPEALPALASGSVAAYGVDRTVTVDVLGRQLPLRIVSGAQLFPTVIERPTAFVVLDYDTLFAALNIDRPGSSVPTEAWFFEPPPAGFANRLEESPFRLAATVGVEPLTDRLLNDPLAAGTRDVFSLVAIAAAALALIGLILATRSALGSERLLLAEYEAMGVPPSTLVRSMQVRLLILSALGAIAGVLGALLAVRLVGAFVAVTGSSTRPLPPIEPVVAWGAIASVLAAIAVAGLATSALLAGRTLRESTARRLRA
jgi:hypothetical protein